MMRPAVAELVAATKAVSSLWSLTLMAAGSAAARGRAADMLDGAIRTMRLAAEAVEASETEQP